MNTMDSFINIFNQYSWDEVKERIYSKTAADVEAALGKQSRTLDDFMALISPAAAKYLEPMAQLSQQLTQQRFGKTIQMYVPMYLSNECNNICTYCGFSLDNKVKRKTLSDKEILDEISVLKQQGFNHILLVTGESNHTVNINYFLNALKLIKPHFANISIEFQPL